MFMQIYDLHHFCFEIAPNTLETVLELFEILGCPKVYREGNKRWAMISQKGKGVNIQIFETKNKPLPTKSRIRTHIAFLSKSPKTDVETVSEWAKKRKIKFVTGGWNERERWFDLPDLFVNFVIEVMDVKVLND